MDNHSLATRRPRAPRARQRKRPVTERHLCPTRLAPTALAGAPSASASALAPTRSAATAPRLRRPSARAPARALRVPSRPPAFVLDLPGLAAGCGTLACCGTGHGFVGSGVQDTAEPQGVEWRHLGPQRAAATVDAAVTRRARRPVRRPCRTKSAARSGRSRSGRKCPTPRS